MKVSRQLLIRFSRDECTPEEMLAVKEWLDDGRWPELPKGEEIPEDVKTVVWAKIRSRMEDVKRNTTFIKGRFLKIAAAVFVLVATGFFIYTFNKTEAEKLSYVSNSHEQKRIVLPDSSIVFLSPRSTLTLAENYSVHHRKLFLTGKAKFEVVSDEDHPFVVVSGDIVTTALGTSFRVNSYPERKKINVVLSYGKVRITNNKTSGKLQPMYLKPGEEVVFDKTSLTIKKVPAEPEQFSYTDHILYFKNAGLREVIEKLERFYQITVDTSDLKQVQWQVSGEFRYQPLEVVMKAIAYSCNINYEINGKNIILKNK